MSVTKALDQKGPITQDGKRYLVRDHLGVLVHLGLLLGVAGELAWHNAWLYGGLMLVAKVISAAVLTRVNPGVVNARGTKQPLSGRERIFFAVYVPSTLSIPTIAALDVGAAGWTHNSSAELYLGLAFAVLGTAGVVWALAVNEHFEPTVRIQRDRDHSVCRAGPYKFVRHPGYVAALALYAGLPITLGSYWCYVPVSVLGVAFVVRTGYEDRLLRAELEGYEDYAAETRYRLLPGVW